MPQSAPRSAASTPPARSGRPPRLTRAEIVAAARVIVDRDGASALTMRRLATAIGSTPMALYHHVRDKDELLVLLLDDYLRQVPRPQLPSRPRDRVVAAAAAMHDALASCPWIVEVLTVGDTLSPTALWCPEDIVRAAQDCGLSPDQAVHVYRNLWYHTVGEIVARGVAVRRSHRDGRPTRRDEVFAALDPDHFPTLAALADHWDELGTTHTYREGLRAFVDGLLPAA